MRLRSRRLAVFTRRPVAGRVKTRLSPALPEDLACQLHAAMVMDALATAGAAAVEERFVYWAEAPESAAASDLPAGFVERVQPEGDLGTRLASAFAELLASEGDRAVIMGADCPALEASVLDAAFAALDQAPLVLGPARDGGYTLIGLARPAPALFEEIAWGTEQVLAQTLERAAALGLDARLLATLDDLDTPADLVRWIAAIAMSPEDRSPHTAAALRAMGLLPPTSRP
jgi:uncharacterized protein